jgi:hypothetical protein
MSVIIYGRTQGGGRREETYFDGSMLRSLASSVNSVTKLSTNKQSTNMYENSLVSVNGVMTGLREIEEGRAQESVSLKASPIRTRSCQTASTHLRAPFGVSVNCSRSESINGLGILPPIFVASSEESPNTRDDFWKMRIAEM